MPVDQLARLRDQLDFDPSLAGSVAPPDIGAAFRATRVGGFVVIEPLTSRALAWLRRQTGDETSWDGNRLAMEMRYFPALADAIIEASFMFEGDNSTY